MKNRNIIKKKRIIIICITCILIALVCLLVSLKTGRFSQASFIDVLKCLFTFFFHMDLVDTNDRIYNVVMLIRFPRTIVALLAGSALACSGVAYQALFSNPIASPDILGVTQGAAFGAVVGILFGLNAILIKILGFFSGCVVVGLVFILANTLSKGRGSSFYLLLIGMIASSLFQSLVSLVKYTADADEKLPQITYWLLGSFNKVTLDDIVPFLILFLIGAVPLLLISWRMNLLVLSYEEALAIGVDIKKLRLVIIICATLLTAISTAVAGCITWFGLLVPHLARFLVGNDAKNVLPVSACMGGGILIMMDVMSRTISIQELPISVLTSITGVPLLLLILFREWRHSPWN